jgi:DNA-binding FrmR family transcriptional regulator
MGVIMNMVIIMTKCEHCKETNNKTTHRDDETKKKINKRLKTIEGQIRGIENMINEDKYCSDILIQLLAINKSIKSLSTEILKNHLSTCVIRDLKNDETEVIDEIMDLIGRFN